MSAYYHDDKGVNYRRFLQAIAPKHKLDNLFYTSIGGNTLRGTKLPPAPPVTDMAALLTRITSIVVRDRVRVYEFMRDFDKHHNNRIPVEAFNRSLQNCKIYLTDPEAKALAEHYAVWL